MNHIQNRRRVAILSHVSVGWLKFIENVLLLDFLICLGYGAIKSFDLSSKHRGALATVLLLVAIALVAALPQPCPSRSMCSAVVRAVVEHTELNE